MRRKYKKWSYAGFDRVKPNKNMKDDGIEGLGSVEISDLDTHQWTYLKAYSGTISNI